MPIALRNGHYCFDGRVRRFERIFLREVKYLPENFIYNTSKLIYGNKVVIYSSKKELVTVIIESTDIAESERKIFDTIWGLSATLTK